MSDHEMVDDERERLARIQSIVADTNSATGNAVGHSVELTDTALPASALERTKADLADAVHEGRRAIDHIETTLVNEYGRATTRETIDDHADRYRERYGDPVWMVACQLLEKNRWEWLLEKDDCNGAVTVEHHGLTANQRSWLDELQAAWEEYDGD